MCAHLFQGLDLHHSKSVIVVVDVNENLLPQVEGLKKRSDRRIEEEKKEKEKKEKDRDRNGIR